MSGDTSLEATLWDAVAALVSAIDGRNRAMGHSMRVADYAVRAAQALGWSKSRLEQLRLGALLHDIGQIYWPDELLNKRDVPLLRCHSCARRQSSFAMPSSHAPTGNRYATHPDGPRGPVLSPARFARRAGGRSWYPRPGR